MLPYKTSRADLRSKYSRYLRLSFIITLLLVIAAFKFSPKTYTEIKTIPPGEDIIFIEPEINTVQKSEPPSLPKPLEPVIDVSDNIEEIIFTDVTINEKKVLTLPVKQLKEKNIVEEAVPFIAVEDKPVLIGGMESLQEKIYYPEIIQRTGIEGKVIVQFIVDKEGNVEEAQVIKSLNEQLDNMVLSAVKELKFEPGKQRGKAVKVKMKIPVSFNLK